MTTDTESQLTPSQIRRIESAMATVLASGWGEVKLVIVKGRLVGIKTEISQSLD